MPRKSKLTLRERKLIAGIAAGLTVSEAARRAGYSKNTIDDRIHEIVGRSRVRQAIDKIMESVGLDDEHLLDALKEGLEATKHIAAGSSRPDSEACIEVPDFQMRLKYLETAFYLKGFAGKKKV